MARSKLLILAALPCLASPGFAQSDFPDNAANHWAYSAKRRLMERGLGFAPPPDASTPAAFARFAIRATQDLAETVARWKRERAFVLHPPKNASDDAVASKMSELSGIEAYAHRLARDVVALRRIVSRFRPEIARDGQNPDALLRRLTADERWCARYRTPKPAIAVDYFPDFPDTHWAWERKPPSKR